MVRGCFAFAAPLFVWFLFVWYWGDVDREDKLINLSQEVKIGWTMTEATIIVLAPLQEV